MTVARRRRTWNRVFVTGMGAVTSHGSSVADLWAGVASGTVAIRRLRRVPTEGLSTELGGEVDVVPASRRWDDRLPRDPVIDFALAAAEEAVADSGLSFDHVAPERWGTVVGTCNAGLISGRRWYADRLGGRTPRAAAAALVTPQALAEAVSGAFGLKGPTLSIGTACAAGANSIGYAADLIRQGHADVVLAGGADALSDVLYAGFNSLESLSPEPATPYARTRQGLSLGEGSGMVVLVEAGVAAAAGLRVLAEVRGYGISADGYHPTAPHPEGEGAARAIRAALTAAGLSPQDVGYVNTHGTGTPKNDAAETKAVHRAFGTEAKRIRLSSTKSMVGHLLGAAGAVEGIVTVKALDEQLAPPTAGLREPDPECDLDYVPGTAVPLDTEIALCNNFAFGGANASVAFARGSGPATAPPEPDFDRVVITGMSALSSAGSGLDALWRSFTDGTGRVERVDPDPAGVLTARQKRRMDRLGVLAVAAAQAAVDHAGLELAGDLRHRVGAVVGTGIGPVESLERFSEPVIREGVKAANPAVFPNTVYNAAGGQVAMHVGALGPATTVTAGHAAGASALAYGYDLVSCGRADAVVCLGADSLTDAVIEAYEGLGLIRNGKRLSLADAGVGVVVERLSSALARGAVIHGELCGYGFSSDAAGFGRHDRDGGGVERAMRAALDHAGLEPDDVSTVWLSRCGHPVADRAEAAALARTLPDATSFAPKLHLGEPLGAWGALGSVLALLHFGRTGDAGPALVNSCSLGGTNATLALAPWR
jgi:3-oxoacyl-[acyl-carrier-protein] synthase II